MLKLIAILLCFSLIVSAQGTPVASAGAIYQAALQQGIAYIIPNAGQSVINKKATINWRNIIIEFVAVASMNAVTSGITGLIAMNAKWIAGLSIAHFTFDQFGVPLLKSEAPTPSNLAPVLAINGAMAPSSTSCVENTIYAQPRVLPSHPRGVRRLKNQAFPSIGPIRVNGLDITFAPQLVWVQKDATGGTLKEFEIFDVIACIPAGVVLAEPINLRKTLEEPPSKTYLIPPPENEPIWMDPPKFDGPSGPYLSLTALPEPEFQQDMSELGIHVVSMPTKVRYEAGALEYNKLGRASIQAGHYQVAIEELNQAVNEDPQCALCYNALGYVYLLTQQPTKAITALNMAIEINKNYVDALHMRTIAQSRLKAN